MEKSLPPKPCFSEVNKYLNKWKNLEGYTSQEEALNKLFLELLPGNSEIADILLKASCLNDFYSTNIFAIHSVVEHILSVKDLDKRLKSGDINLVSELGNVKIGDNKRYFYSFATKYCSHHNPIAFPIYDSYVERVLLYFNKVDKFSSFRKEDLKNYRKFKGILLDFQRYYKLERFNLKKIDRYLWLLGKEFFPKK
ncbi:Uncharacterised protein [Haemophilus parainfluenzae]|uniref:30S ribosomal protein S15 n=1 Tax=Haemophilus parainfluenzae TaxID=729 RepID=A0A448Q8L9_HAEPA|nr:hypothetical protein [Haemophilus parainfluenzae]VEI33247.1 Uncharacterised protein [Haemophilus parainfluenzae]